MVNGTRIDPEEHEPRAIKIGGKKRKKNKKKIIIPIIASVLVVAIGIFAFIIFGDNFEFPKLPLGENGESSSQSESAPEESNSSESEPEIPAESSSSFPESSETSSESSSSLPESSSESEPEEPEEPEISKDAWYLLLVNKENPLPEDFSVAAAPIDNSGKNVDARIVPELKAMISDGEKEGLDFIFYTAYRSVAKQKELYEAGKTAAKPGTSEHNSGLAVDIGSATKDNFIGSAEEKWLLDHAHEYGFILRYPKSKESITGFDHEPWHFRYVGKEAAAFMKENNICLEEYLAQ